MTLTRLTSVDPELFALLHPVAKTQSARRLRLLERERVVPGALYFNEYVPSNSALRCAYMDVLLSAMNRCDLIFFDPDNGLDIKSVPKGATDAPKFLYRDEVQKTYAAGHSLLIYQHFPREERDGYIARLRADLQQAASDAKISAFKTGHVVFLLVLQPAHSRLVDPAALVSGWDASFMHLAAG